MAFPRNLGFTPDQRGPALGDERPHSGARQRSPVLEHAGYKEANIRLTPTSTDVSTGTPAVTGLYDFGAVDQQCIGRYIGQYQDAASATADGLGAIISCEFDIREQTAGVFQAVVITDLEGGTATSDADDSRQTDATLTAVADATLDGAGSDTRATYFVATADDVTDAAAWTSTAATLVQGHLYLLDAHAVSTRVHSLKRLW